MNIKEIEFFSLEKPRPISTLSLSFINVIKNIKLVQSSNEPNT